MKELTIKEAGSKGGRKTLKKYGKKHFSKLGKLSAKKRKDEPRESNKL